MHRAHRRRRRGHDRVRVIRGRAPSRGLAWFRATPSRRLARVRATSWHGTRSPAPRRPSLPPPHVFSNEGKYAPPPATKKCYHLMHRRNSDAQPSRRRMGPGGPRGLQSRCEARRTSRVCSIRTRLRQKHHRPKALTKVARNPRPAVRPLGLLHSTPHPYRGPSPLAQPSPSSLGPLPTSSQGPFPTSSHGPPMPYRRACPSPASRDSPMPIPRLRREGFPCLCHRACPPSSHDPPTPLPLPPPTPGHPNCTVSACGWHKNRVLG